MNKRTRIILLIIVASVIVLAAWGLNSQSTDKQQDVINAQSQISGPQTGQYRPDFTLKDLANVTRSLSDWHGQVIVLNFWATWCRPCLQEIPMFVDVQRQMADQGVQFLGLAIDDRTTVETFLQRTGIEINYPLLIGDNEAIQIAIDYGNDSGILPFTVIIDGKGHIRFHHFGAISREQLVSELNRVI